MNMPIYRQIQTSYWQDNFVLQLTPEERYFYIYLLTNSHTKQCGIYELPIQVINLETGYNQETAEKLLQRFVDYGKIIYCIKTREIGIVNWLKYNPMESPKTRVCVIRELKEVKERSLIDRIYSLNDTNGKEIPASVGPPEADSMTNNKKYPIQGVLQKEEEQEKEKTEEEAEEEEPSASSSSANKYLKKENKEGEEGDNRLLDSRFRGNDNGGIENRFRTFIDPLLGGVGTPDREFRNDSADYGDYRCEGIQNQAKMILFRIWNKNNPTPEECRITANMILKYGYQEAEAGFKESVKHNKKSFAYAEKCSKGIKERAELAKKEEEDKIKRREVMNRAEEERKDGKGLNLIKQIYRDDGSLRNDTSNIA